MKRGYKPVISCFENLDCKRKNFTGTNTIERRIESKLFFCLPSRYCFTTSILDSSKYLLFPCSILLIILFEIRSLLSILVIFDAYPTH